MGWSQVHASNVALVRNLSAGYISPQFHVVFDNWFETIAVDDDSEDSLEWDVIVTRGRHQANIDPEDLVNHQLDDEWLSEEELIQRRIEQQVDRDRQVRGKSRFKDKSATVETPTTTESARQVTSEKEELRNKAPFSSSEGASLRTHQETPTREQQLSGLSSVIIITRTQWLIGAIILHLHFSLKWQAYVVHIPSTLLLLLSSDWY